MTTFRKGDVVSLNLIVESHFNDCDVRLRQPNSYTDIFAKAIDLTVVKHEFRVGDRVEWATHDGADSWFGYVLSISNDHLWVQLDDGSYSTVWSGKASRIDPKPSHQDEAA